MSTKQVVTSPQTDLLDPDPAVVDAAMSTLYRTHERWLYRLLYRELHDAYAAQDALSEVMVKAMIERPERLAELDDEHVRNYLAKAAYNRCNTLRREAKARRDLHSGLAVLASRAN